MRTAVISYSFTGNNNTLAAALAKAIDAEHIAVKPQKQVKMGDIVFDMMFKRTPKVQPDVSVLTKYGRVVLMGPIWCGGPASPLRPYLKQLKAHPQPYAFVTLSGGGLNPNQGFPAVLKKEAGSDPYALVTKYIVDFMPKDPQPTAKETSAFRLGEAQAEQLAAEIAEALKA